MRLNDLQKAWVKAGVRVALAPAFAYVTVGCILFPLWWKEFLFQGGFLRYAFWRDGFRYLHGEFVGMKSLAAIITVSVFVLILYIAFWIGKRSSVASKEKITFLKKLPPSNGYVIFLCVCSVVAALSTARESGSYTENTATTKLLNQLMMKLQRDSQEMLDSGGDEFAPPTSGTYLYLNDKLIVRQYQALQDEAGLKSVTKSFGTETNVSLDVKLPVLGVGIGAAGKSSSGVSVVRATPEVSPTFAAQQLIKRFHDDASIFKCPLVPPFVSTSDFFVRQLSEKGVTLTETQINALRKRDRAESEKVFDQLRVNAVFLYHGQAQLVPRSRLLQVVIPNEGLLKIECPVKLQVTAILDNEYLQTDSPFFASHENEKNVNFLSVRMLTVIQSKEKNSAGDYVLKVVVYAIW